jgi:hypothetical protein
MTRVRVRGSVRVRFRVRMDRSLSSAFVKVFIVVMLCYGTPSTPVSAVFASRWPRVSASERHSVELQRYLAVFLIMTTICIYDTVRQ